MRRGPKLKPTMSPRLKEGGVPRCPDHLDADARKEWRRLARTLHEAGILTVADRAAFAAYCQSYSLWAEAVRKQRETPRLIKTPSGYVQQSPWIAIANKQLELMGRYMAELGITPTSRTRLSDVMAEDGTATLNRIELVWRGPDGTLRDKDGTPVEDKPAGLTLDADCERL
ncbi:phage terminase small subunit P27 family [Pelagovum pacificum]|uniref:phage terminase small subunit P27 family n=1 Tax=Pelagovum pacificum TaxID=2588711 RepID=UPI0018E2C616|nr:phage terminase small subunit P27 family [Pelagovum pacificum]QQA41474.1 phage terminase small subunit P27 family [Pelagovum pacificum]QQA41505.1 phage terminase small subunit P27 family [Pelagovum pacificum]